MPIENTDWLLVSFTMLTGFAAVLSFCHFVNGRRVITDRKIIAEYEQTMIEAEAAVDNIQDADLTVHDLVQIRERNYVSVEL